MVTGQRILYKNKNVEPLPIVSWFTTNQTLLSMTLRYSVGLA